MNIALIYPPTCDPTGVYLSIPSLTAYLRTNGVNVLPIDANIEAYDRLLRTDVLIGLAKQVEKRLGHLERKKRLRHAEQLAFSSLWQARGDAQICPGAVEDALSVFRDRSGKRFFDPSQYETAVTTIESALRLISAAHTPLCMDFASYRTPFSMLSMAEMETDARPERNPFHDYFEGELSGRLVSEEIGLAGISVVFPGQIQPAYSLAFALRRQVPDIHITVGGPAITQMLVRLEKEKRANALGPFHSAVLFEGEEALLGLIRTLESGEKPDRIIFGSRQTRLASLPAPDFDGLPLEKYLSPAPVLPYDPTRGCYWGKCAFCHYGLSEKGTACYRERPVEQISEHIRHLAKRYGCKIFYFSHDSMNPKTAFRMAQNFIASGISCRWATDMRAEPSLTPECCRVLSEGGALSIALGIESASPRVLGLINKGITVRDMRAAITNLANSGIGAEAMCFTDFPTETCDEALSTIRFVRELRDGISLFVCGSFSLTHGARVAMEPGKYGIGEIWRPDGDELGATLFYAETRDPKTDAEREKINTAEKKLSRDWLLRRYPWAGSLSTAHTLLWYDKYGPGAFRIHTGKFAGMKTHCARKHTARSRFDVGHVMRQCQAREAEIWHTLVNKKRIVTRNEYEKLSLKFPPEPAKPGRWEYSAGKFPKRAK